MKKKVGPVPARIKGFWDDQANAHKESQLATAPDPFYREHEINSICAYLKDGADVLDVGCGNGYSTLIFAKRFSKSTFTGVDYSEPMVSYAEQARGRAEKSVQKRTKFSHGNVLSLSQSSAVKGRKFDFIIAERCLINLGNWDEQKQAILEMKKCLKKNGRILLTENTQEGMARLNELRTGFGLHAIQIRWHNFYIPEKKLLEFAPKHFHVEAVENIGNLYYILSRVVYAKLAQIEGKDPDYMHPINEIASKLPSLGGYHFSPNFIFVLKNK